MAGRPVKLTGFPVHLPSKSSYLNQPQRDCLAYAPGHLQPTNFPYICALILTNSISWDLSVAL